MADAEQSIPDIYREAAEEVRQLARRARLTDIRGDLLELSARFERLAAYADAAIRLGVPGYPHGERLPVADDRSDRARAADGPLSSDSGPHTESVSPKPRLREQVIDQVENGLSATIASRRRAAFPASPARNPPRPPRPAPRRGTFRALRAIDPTLLRFILRSRTGRRRCLVMRVMCPKPGP
jgi:hypothetical protein